MFRIDISVKRLLKIIKQNMNTNKKIVLGLLALIVVVVGYMFLSSGNPLARNDEKSIRFGIMLPFSGSYGALGETLKKSSLIAIEEYQATHPGVKIEVVSEDDGFDVKKGVPAYNKLVSIDKVDSLMILSTPITDAIHTKMNADGIPIMSIGVQNDGIGPDNIFQMALSPILPVENLAKFIETKNHKKIAVVYNSSLTLTKRFQETFAKNYSLPHEDFAVNDAQTAKITATKILSGDFDSVVVLEDGVGGPAIVKDLKTLDTQNKLTFYFDLNLATAWGEYQKMLGDTNKLNGDYFVKLKSEDLTEFNQKYKAKYGAEPGPYSEYGYDTTMVLLQTYDQDQITWKKNIQNTSFSGYTGKTKFDSDGVNLKDTEILTVQNGSLSGK